MLRQLRYQSSIRCGRVGFTLVELLVVIAIISVLMSLLIPAVQQGRENARLVQCKNNLHQICLALRQHESAHTSFPPGLPNCNAPNKFYIVGGVNAGAICQGPNWAVAILPYMEEASLYDRVIACTAQKGNACDDCSKDDTANQPRWTAVGTTTPSTFRCPSAELVESMFNVGGSPPNAAPVYDLSNLAKGNYAGNFGTHDYMSYSHPFHRGAFDVVNIGSPKFKLIANDPSLNDGSKLASNKGTRTTDFCDGLSKTVIVSEVLGFENQNDGRGAWTWSGMGGSSYTAGATTYEATQRGGTPNSSEADKIPICGFQAPASALLPKLCTEDRTDGNVYASARSAHSAAGVCVVMADASVHFASDEIDPKVWIALHSRCGHRSEDNLGVKSE